MAKDRPRTVRLLPRLQLSGAIDGGNKEAAMDGANDGGNKEAAYFGIPVDCGFSPVVFEECMNEYVKSLAKKSGTGIKPGSMQHGDSKTFGDNAVKEPEEKADTMSNDDFDDFGEEDVWSKVDLETINDIATVSNLDLDESLAIDGFQDQMGMDESFKHANEVTTPSLLTFAGQLPASFLHEKTSSNTRSELDAPNMPKRK